jgi:hypothetical protein
MAMILARMPWNRGAVCDVRDVVARLAVSDQSAGA